MQGPKASREINNRMQMNGIGHRIFFKSEKPKEYIKFLLLKTFKVSVTGPGAIHKTNKKYGKQSMQNFQDRI